MISNKQDFLKFIKGAGVGLYGGSPAQGTTVKFQMATGDNAIGRALASNVAGALTFASDSNGNAAIFATDGQGNGTLVSSKILNIESAAASSNKHGGKTVTISYVDATQPSGVNTATFDVIDEAGLEAYFANSKTIAFNDTTDVFEVKVDGTTILVDESNGLKTGLKIAYIAEEGTTGATIALRDNSDNVLSSINVSDIVGDGVLKGSIYHEDTNILELRFGNGKVYNPADPTTYTAVNVDLQKLIDINDVFIANDSSVYLHAELDASTVTLSTNMQDPSTADATHTGLADALKVKQYVDSKTTDLAVSASGDDYVAASVAANDKKHINVAATDDLKVAVANANSAIQGIVEGNPTSEQYVSLTIANHTTDSSTKTITVDDTDLVAKISEIDGSIGDVSTRLFNKTSEIDTSIDRLDTSVSGIETQIAAMDADISTASELDAAEGIYVRGTLAEENGVVTSIGLTSLIANTSITRYDKAGDIDPAWTLNDDVAAQLRDEAGAVDSSKSDADSANFISIHEEQENGEIKVFTVDSSYGAYNYTAGTHTFGTVTDGLAKVADTQTFVQNVVESLDLANDVADASAADAAGFVKTTISETNGIVKNERVDVSYGNYSTHENGIATTADTSAFVQSLLTWTIL